MWGTIEIKIKMIKHLPEVNTIEIQTRLDKAASTRDQNNMTVKAVKESRDEYDDDCCQAAQAELMHQGSAAQVTNNAKEMRSMTAPKGQKY